MLYQTVNLGDINCVPKTEHMDQGITVLTNAYYSLIEEKAILNYQL